MSEHTTKQAPGSAPPAPHVDSDPMLYEEPPRMGWRDSLGVMAALIALVLIGVAGYIWLTPGMTLGKLLGQGEQAASATVAAHDYHSEMPTAEDVAGMAGMDAGHTPRAGAPAAVEHVGEDLPAGMGGPVEDPASEAEQVVVPAADTLANLSQHNDTECPTCGMDGARSLAHVVARWSDGTHTHHDCFDCLFTWGMEQGLTLDGAQVLKHGTTTQDADWLDATGATYLYGTSRIEMSMPPYVAAFESRAAAEAAQPELGGEVMDFAQLTSHWK